MSETQHALLSASGAHRWAVCAPSEIEWRDVVGREGEYQVSRCGKVRSIDRVIPVFSARAGRMTERWFPGCELSLHIRPRDGYVSVAIAGKTRKVHQLVAEAFIPNPDKLPDVDHRNGNKADNLAENLRWASKSLNGSNRFTPWCEIGVLGVFKSSSQTNPYRSSIRFNGKPRHLGVFPTIEAASAAYQYALKEAMQDV